MNAFDNGDDEDEEEDDNDQGDEEEEPLFKRVLAKLTQTKKTAVFSPADSACREEIYCSSQEIQTMGKDRNARTSVGESISTNIIQTSSKLTLQKACESTFLFGTSKNFPSAEASALCQNSF